MGARGVEGQTAHRVVGSQRQQEGIGARQVGGDLQRFLGYEEPGPQGGHGCPHGEGEVEEEDVRGGPP